MLSGNRNRSMSKQPCQRFLWLSDRSCWGTCSISCGWSIMELRELRRRPMP